LTLSIFRQKAQDLLDSGLPIGLVSMPEKFPIGVSKWNNPESRPSFEAWPKYSREGVCLFTGDIEIIDVDTKNWKEKGDFNANLLQHLRSSLSFFDDLIYYKTLSGGMHLPYRTDCAEGNQKLAIRCNEKQALIETRGLNGLAVCPPTTGYKWLSNGEWDDLPTLSASQRKDILNLCREYNQAIDTEKADREISRALDSSDLDLTKSGDHWTSEVNFIEYLQGYGWTTSRVNGHEVLLCRPGKKAGISASWNWNGLGRLWVFSSSTELPIEKMLTPFAVKSYFDHNGNFEDCAKALREDGYGLEPDYDALGIEELKDGMKDLLSSPASKPSKKKTKREMIEAAEIDLDQNDEDSPKEKVLSAADQLTLKEYEESLFEDDDEDEVIGDLDFEVQGPLGQLYREILDSATYPNKAIAFAGALVGFSGLIERKWSTPLDGRANLEIVCLANSGSGKDHPRKFISRLYHDLGIQERTCGVAASKEGLEDFFSISNPPVGVSLADEADGLLQALKNPNDRNARGLWDYRLELYSSANSVIKTRMKAGGNRSLSIVWPFLSVLSSAIPNMFFGALTDTAILKGLVPRCIVLDSGGRGKINRNARGIQISENLIDNLKQYVTFSSNDGNIQDIGISRPDIKQLKWGSGSDQFFFDTIVAYCDKRHDTLENKGKKSSVLWSRAAENTAKLALLYSLSIDGPECERLSMSSLHWAWEIIQSAVTGIESRIDSVGSSKDSEMMQKIMSIVKRSKDSKISRTSLLKAVRMKSRELDQYLETLIESVQLIESAMTRESGFGPKRIVFYSA
jgi:hypothetical protein